MEDREVTTRTIRLEHAPTGMRDVRFVAKYNRHGDDFYVEVPHWLLHKNKDDQATVEGKTPKLALDAVEDLCRNYKGHLTKKRRVILFKFQGAKRNDRDPDYDRADRLMHNVDPRTIALALRWHACWEFWTPDQVVRQYGETDKCPSRIEGGWITLEFPYSDMHVVDWTPARENFLRSLETSMVRAMDQMTKFFRNPKKAAKAMDAAKGQKLLT